VFPLFSAMFKHQVDALYKDDVMRSWV